ncbi:hypothetical protein JNUCC0626_40065 [Lentzea sp. JNUCC 0626]|uniref:hypothetical protein n=1 Tax=Lentzea sp. JNUCC 0626 TaxID=3367513 RepID=UPI003748F070
MMVYLDVGEFDFHIDAAPEARTCRIRLALSLTRQLGFQPIPVEECEPELLDNGWTRMYLAPIEPTPDTPEDADHWQTVITTIPMQVRF